MRKVWIYQRPNRRGWYVGWYENGRRKAKSLPSKTLAVHYQQIKYVQINSDVYTGIITISWPEMIKEYREYKELLGLKKSSLWEAMHTLEIFALMIRPVSSRDFNQARINKFILLRKEQVERYTLNKDISYLRAFCRWAESKNYIRSIQLNKLKVQQPKINALDSAKIKKLLAAVRDNNNWHIRVLLALSTGLRRGDIEALKVSDINLKAATINTFSKKTSKSMTNRPLPQTIIPILTKHIKNLPKGHVQLFSDRYSHKKWKKFRNKAGLSTCKFQDLRKTFASVLAQKGAGQSVVQTLLEHSTPTLTHQIYTNVDPVLRDTVELLPTNEWLD